MDHEQDRHALKSAESRLVVMFGKLSGVVSSVASILKGVVIVGSSVIAICQFASPTLPNTIPISAAICVLLAGVLLLMFDRSSAEELSEAYSAIARAKEAQERALRAEQELELILADYEERITRSNEDNDDLFRATSLYQAVLYMNEAVEGALVVKQTDPIALIDSFFTVAGRQLVVGANFSQRSEFTVCIYRAQTSQDGSRVLHLIADKRAIPCDPARAREWPVGVGVAGNAFITSKEVIVPDLLSADLGSAFKMDDGMIRPWDQSRYRSMIAVPIVPANDSAPWGVVVGTSDIPGHFTPGKSNLPNALAIRALAELAETAVVACRTSAQIKDEKAAVASNQSETQEDYNDRRNGT